MRLENKSMDVRIIFVVVGTRNGATLCSFFGAQQNGVRGPSREFVGKGETYLFFGDEFLDDV